MVRLQAGEATVADYIFIGCTNVTELNVVDVNWYVASQSTTTVANIKSSVTTIINALNYINNGTTTISYYKTIGIETITSDTVSVVRAQILAAKATKGVALTKAEITQIVEKTNVNITNIRERILAGVATVEDYEFIGITTVTKNIVKDVNKYMATCQFTTISQIKTLVNDYVTIITNVNKGTTVLSNYTKLSIQSVTSDNVTVMKAAITAAYSKKGELLNIAEIQSIVDATLTRFNAAMEYVRLGQGSVEDYQFLLLTSVTNENVMDVNWYVRTLDCTTYAKVSNSVNEVITALVNVNKGSTSVSYYKTLGFTTVTSDNVSFIVKRVIAQRAIKTIDLNRTEIEILVNDGTKEYESLLAKFASGTATIEDYQSLKITTVTAANIDDVNWYLSTHTTNTISLVKSNVSAVTEALKCINNGSTSSSYFQTLGIERYNSSFAAQIKTKIQIFKESKGTALTRNEILESVNQTMDYVDATLERIQKGYADVRDYTYVGITTVTELTLKDVNWYITSHDSTTYNKIRSNVSTVLNALTNINNGSTQIDNFNILGIQGHDVTFCIQIKEDIQAFKGFKQANLTREEIQTSVLNTMNYVNQCIERIQKGHGEVRDYTFIGIKTVTELTLKDVNWYITNHDSTTYNKIRSNVSTVLDALKNINNGSTNSDYFKILGITKYNPTFATQIKNDIQNVKKVKGAALTREEIEVSVINTTNYVITVCGHVVEGQATLEEYHFLSLKNVSELTLQDVNWYVSTHDSSTYSKISSNVSTVLNALSSINNGNTSSDYFKILGITKYNPDRASQIKSNIQETKKAKGQNLTKSEIEAIVLDAIQG